MFRVAIPARFASTRLPGKVLAPIAGRPMIEHAHRLALQSGAAEIVIATDDERVRAACAAFGAMVEMTSSRHQSGGDRIAEVAQRRGWAEDSIVVNLQADEPLLPAVLIGQAARLLAADAGADIATLCAPIATPAAFLDPNVVKVVMRADGRALYFSRAPIPRHRDGAQAGQPDFRGACRHIGIYAYRVGALRRLASMPPSPLEQIERLEQLRALEAGMTVTVGAASELPGPGVDTAADLAEVERLMSTARRI